MNKKKEIQSDGFLLMQYSCENSHLEILWNSRPYITPFTISCKCGAISRHINWNMDRYAPFHKPKKGDRIFVDLTMDIALPKAIDYVNKYWDKDMSKMFESKEVAVKCFAEIWVNDYGGHSPTVIEVTDEQI